MNESKNEHVYYINEYEVQGHHRTQVDLMVVNQIKKTNYIPKNIH